MSIMRKLKSLFGAKIEDDTTASAPAAQENAAEPEQAETDDEATRKREEALLDALANLHIVQRDTQSTSFLLMLSYRFEKPFSVADMRDLIGGMRWLGFRLYSFSVRIAGEEVDCESWHIFTRHLAESPVQAVSLITSFGGVRVNATIDSEGSVHFSHDSSRGVDFSPFESLFDPEEIEPEEE